MVFSKEGRAVWINMTVSLVRGLDGEPTYFIAVVEDIANRKRLEAQLVQSQKMESIGKLAGGIAHEFNNMMTAILGFAELASEKPPGDLSIKSDLDQIMMAGRRTADLTGQLLAFARKQMIQPKIVSLNDLISENNRLLERVVGEGITLHFDLKQETGRVKADPSQLTQAFVNLAVNAKDAMPGGGILTIRTENIVVKGAEAGLDTDLTPGEYVLLTVSDTGIGMDKRTQARIFEPFFTTKGVGEGTGLGLATCYGILKQSGGHIEVTSAPNEGASFRMYLPRVAAEQTQLISEERVVSARGQETILIVEDEAQVRKMLTTILANQGYTVLEAASGEEALCLAEKYTQEIHLLMADVVMPQMSGRELAERLCQKQPSLKVMLISGYTAEQMEASSRHDQEKGYAFLPKPFSPKELARVVRSLLNTCRQQQEPLAC